ncbi:MAG: CHAT domain-containing protein, partial [Candidatus Binatota bacterium]
VNELYSLSLDADLVTLSACETGLGKISNGDDVVGLTRGFLYAGSRSIIASLWKVDDLSTSQLMTQFYSTLQQSNKREALRQAQLEIQKTYPHPFFWAAFQLTGNGK